MSLATAMGTLALAATSANAAVILADDFTGRSLSGTNATIGGWDTANGITAPSTTLTFKDGDSATLLSFFDVSAGHIDVNNNMNSGGWDTTVTIAVGAANIDLTTLDLDLKLISGSGGDQPDPNNKVGQMLVEIFDAGLVSVGQDDLGGNVAYSSVSYSRQLDLTGTTLLANQTYTMVLQARGSGDGHHKAFDALSLNGDVVPEPSSAALLGLGGLALLRRRRK